MSDQTLMALAEAAGISLGWTDAFGQPQSLTPDTLRGVLAALDLPAQSEDQIRHQPRGPAGTLEASTAGPLIPVITGQDSFASWSLSPPGSAFRITQESGQRVSGRLDADGCLPVIAECGYHQLMIGDAQLILATAPARCQSVKPVKLRGSAVTSGASRHQTLLPCAEVVMAAWGDTLALEKLVRQAASSGADRG